MSGEIGSRRWVKSLAPRGRLVLVEVALAAARQALAVFEAEHPNDREPRETVEAIEAWLATPTEGRARAVIPLTYRRGDPSDIDGVWLVLGDGSVPSPTATEAYFAADYAGNCVYAGIDFAVEAARAAVACAASAGVPKDALRAAVERAAAKKHTVAFQEEGSYLPARMAPPPGRLGEPDRSRPSVRCPECGGEAHAIGPKESFEGVDHVPHRCVSCGHAFHTRAPSLSVAYGKKDRS